METWGPRAALEAELAAARLDIARLRDHDEQTGLLNRAGFLRRLPGLIAELRARNGQAGLIVFDLDWFRRLNDSLGLANGDALLVAVSRRVAALLGPDDVFARLDGDEFAIFAPVDGPARAEIAVKSATILHDFSHPYTLDGQNVAVGSSLGVSLMPDDADNATDLLRYALVAGFAAKISGRARIINFTGTVLVRFQQRIEMEMLLRTAIDNNAMTACYQPIHHIASGRIVGMEALARWEHPKLGMVPPDQFIPLTEKNQLIRRLGNQILRKACTQTVAWLAEGLIDYVSVNVSPAQVQDGAVVEDVLAAIRETGMDPARLVLEVTESLELMDSANVRRSLDAFRVAGIRLALDDFGAGFSNLAYLNRLPIDRIKIDRSLVQTMSDTAMGQTILQSVIDLAHRLGLQVIVEGVETQPQLDVLRGMGADYAQGYLFSPPLTAEAMNAMLRAG